MYPLRHYPRPALDQPLCLLAGRGMYPFTALRAARAAGVPRIHVVGMIDEAEPALAAEADSCDWVHVGQIGKVIDSCRKRQVSQMMMIGQVKPTRLFGGIRPDLRAFKILARLKEKNAHSLFGAICDCFEEGGLSILPAHSFLDSCLATPGQLGRIALDTSRAADAAYGWQLARECARLDIGQSLVVKRGSILAVEGFEGTDRCILRGGELGRGGVTVIKVAKDGHDLRFDIPVIGLRTVDSLAAAKARSLILQAGLTLFIDRVRVLSALDELGICVYGVDPVKAEFPLG